MTARHSLHRFLLILAVLGFLFVSFIDLGFAAKDPIRIRQTDDLGVRIDYHNETGKLSFLGVSPESPIVVQGALNESLSMVDRSMAVLDVYGADFGLENPAQELRLMRERINDKGRTSVRYQQVYKGIPVLAGELIVNQDSMGRLISISGEISPDLSISTTPVLSSADAKEMALKAIAKYYDLSVGDLKTTDPELWVFDERLLIPSERPANLVWRMEVSGKDRIDIRELALVDADLGGIALHFNQVDVARDRETYDAGNGATLPGTLVCDESDPTCSGAGGDQHAVKAHEYAGDTYDFYASHHGRDSIDDVGMTIVSTVHYGTGYANAFWSGSQMVYGDYYGFPLADDVVGHELSHGVTDYESHLFYFYQSGAINEALSDIFGEFVDLTNGAGNDTGGVRWQMGEDISGLGAIRDMSNPPAFGDPDRTTHPNYICSWSDNGGVHRNSGVVNKAAYLLTDGDTFNGYDVAGIGISNTADLFYEVNTTLLTSGSNFNDLYNALIQASFNIGLGPGQRHEVIDAVEATEMDIRPCGDTAEAPICTGGLTPSDIFFDDLENTGSGNWISTADVGVNEWYYPQNTHSYPFDATNTSSGIYNFWGYDQQITADINIAMTSDVTLPAHAYLHFKHYWDFEDDFDGGVVEYSTNGGSSWIDAGSLFTYNGYSGTISNCCGNPIGGQDAFIYESRGYNSSRLDLSSLVGEDVRFRFRIGTDESVDDYGWFIDDIRIYNCPTSTELISNTMFDVFVPNYWRGVDITGNDGPDCTTSASGSCSAKMVGNGTVKQINYVGTVNGSAGDDLTFNLWNRTSGAAGPFFAKAVLVYTDSTQEIFKILPDKGTHGWQEYTLDFTAAKDYDRVRIFLLYGAGSGTVWFDDVSLTLGPSSTEVLIGGEFEIFVPKDWRGVNLNTVDGSDCTTSASGSCSTSMVGDGAVKQTTYVGAVSGSAGDSLLFTLWNRTDGAGGPFFAKAVLVYTDNSQQIFKILPDKGTHGWHPYELNLTAAKDYNRIRIFLIYGAGSGTVWFDDVSLAKY
jgi:bacillolysin